MPAIATFVRHRSIALAIFAYASCQAGLSPALGAGPFAGFAGTWIGAGDVSLTDGSSERIRCKAVYSAGSGAAALNVHVTCASDSFKVDLLSDLEAEGRSFTGSWQETTRQAQGSVTGQIVAPGQIQANLAGAGFGIQLSASTNGAQQAVTIVSQGTDVRRVTIKLKKV